MDPARLIFTAAAAATAFRLSLYIHSSFCRNFSASSFSCKRGKANGVRRDKGRLLCGYTGFTEERRVYG